MTEPLMKQERMEEDQICVTLQMGVNKEHLNLVRTSSTLLDTVKERAKTLVEKHGSSQQQQKISEDRLMLFRHDYNSSNLLQLLESGEELNNGSVVEVVLSSKNERPTRPHILTVHSYRSPTFCDYCGEILVGLVRQGLRCSKCHLNFHKKCAFAPHNNCSSNKPPTEQELADSGGGTQKAAFGLPHTFVVHSYKKPTVCKFCNNLLVGLMKQGLQCRDCKVNVHKKCASSIPYDCFSPETHRMSSAPSEHMETEESVINVMDNSEQVGERLSTGDLIPLARLPGQAAVRHSRPPKILQEGWLIHFTNHQPDRRLRHYWILEPGAINMYNEGLHRVYKVIAMSEILGLKPYEGVPLDPRFPPHCFEIQTAQTIYYVGENLEWYARNGQGPPAAKLPRRENGVGSASAEKWFAALRQAFLPPPVPREPPGAEVALEFSQLYQVNANDELGSGQFGTVYGGVHRQSGRRVAIKVIAKERFGKKQREQLRSEVAILQAVNHPGIIRLESMFETKDKIFVVMEKMEADMLEMILSSRLGRLTERVTKFLIHQILAALRYLHSKDIAHCDLKPENVLLSSSDTDFPQTKLCDFGYARFIGESQFRKTVVGTPAYLAPEVLQKRGYNKSLDMWSVGVVIYVTLSGTFPFNEGEEISEQIQNAAFMYPASPWSEISQDAIDLISKLLKVQIEERMSIEECMAHKWLHDAQLTQDLQALEHKVGVRYLTESEILGEEVRTDAMAAMNLGGASPS